MTLDLRDWSDASEDARLRWRADAVGPALRAALLPDLRSRGVARLQLLDDLGRHSERALCHLVAALAQELGAPLPQRSAGDLLTLVRDEAADYRSPEVRGHATSAALGFHSDRCDLSLLLYVRVAASGGEVAVVGYDEVADLLATRDPAALASLRAPIPFDLRPERIFERPTWHARPVLWDLGLGVRGHYIRRFITDSQRHPDCPRLRPDQQRALNRLDEVLADLRPARTFTPRPGELLIVDNYRVAHARTAFESAPAGRLALRVWLAPPWSERLPDFLYPLTGACAAGVYRGGVGTGAAYHERLGTPVTVKEPA